MCDRSMRHVSFDPDHAEAALATASHQPEHDPAPGLHGQVSEADNADHAASSSAPGCDHEESPSAPGCPGTPTCIQAESFTAVQIDELKKTVSDLCSEMLGAPEPVDHRRQQGLEDENINLKIRMRQMEEIVADLRDQVGTSMRSDPDTALHAELSALTASMEQKQGELVQARREVARAEAQLEEAHRNCEAARTEASLLRTQLESARVLNEKHFSLKGDLWPLLANTSFSAEKKQGQSSMPQDGSLGTSEASDGDRQLVVGLRQLREAYDNEAQRAFFLDSELEAAAKQIAELENELTRRDQALGELQSGLANALQVAEQHSKSPEKTGRSLKHYVNGQVQTDPSEEYLVALKECEEKAAGIATTAAQEMMKLRGSMETMQVELQGAKFKCETLSRDNSLAQDKLAIVQEEVSGGACAATIVGWSIYLSQS